MLNLDFTGLFESAIHTLISNLNCSETMLSLHLCGNDDLGEEFLDWIRSEVGARKEPEVCN